MPLHFALRSRLLTLTFRGFFVSQICVLSQAAHWHSGAASAVSSSLCHCALGGRCGGRVHGNTPKVHSANLTGIPTQNTQPYEIQRCMHAQSQSTSCAVSWSVSSVSHAKRKPLIAPSHALLSPRPPLPPRPPRPRPPLPRPRPRPRLRRSAVGGRSSSGPDGRGLPDSSSRRRLRVCKTCARARDAIMGGIRGTDSNCGSVWVARLHPRVKGGATRGM